MCHSCINCGHMFSFLGTVSYVCPLGSLSFLDIYASGFCQCLCKLYCTYQSKHTNVCFFSVSWQSSHASLNKTYILLQKAKEICRNLSFINRIVIPKHHSMRLSFPQVPFFWTSLSPTCLPSKADK